MRLGLAAFAGFVISAFVQRLILAQFSVKVGPSGLELGPLDNVSETLEARLTELEEGLQRVDSVVQGVLDRQARIP